MQNLLVLGSGTLLSGFTRSKRHIEMKEVVSNIKPLGFQWETKDPFLFCVHHEDYYPKGNDQYGPADDLSGRQLGQDFIVKDGYRMYHGQVVPGFPGHPHRGFETVTVVRKGLVDHSDSQGASGRYGNGDVQWMTAGSGLQHSEMFPLLHKDKENTLELFQIWLNLPAKSKMTEPHFKMLWSEEIAKEELVRANGKVFIELIAGAINNKKSPNPPPHSWANDMNNDVAIWNIKMDAGTEWEVPAAKEGTNRVLYFYEGDDLLVDEATIPTYHSADIKADEKVKVKASTKTSILILQGQPIKEPVVQHGPFVMNTREEIQQAFADYQQTHFGGWPWPTSYPVHGGELKRFAKHANGVHEEKSL